MTRLKTYEEMLTWSYEDTVEFLLKKYGPAKDDYFRENSYKRFLNNEIKNITKGKYSRTAEGLYCHHIDEYKTLKISDQDFIKKHNIPYDYQKKERLVYCDLIEHAILHVLIIKEHREKDINLEYSGNFEQLPGQPPGYEAYLAPLIEEWFLIERVPSPPWMLNCYNAAFLAPEQTLHILRLMNKVAGIKEEFPKTVEEYQEQRRRVKEERERRREITRRRNEQWAEELRIREEIKRKELAEFRASERKRMKRKKEELIESRKKSYMEMTKSDVDLELKWAKQLHEKSSRQEILDTLYYLKYKESYDAFRSFDSAMKRYVKDRLLDEVSEYVKEIEKEKKV